ncbi:unnamed protein product [Malus baccata var. baccata]
MRFVKPRAWSLQTMATRPLLQHEREKWRENIGGNARERGRLVVLGSGIAREKGVGWWFWLPGKEGDSWEYSIDRGGGSCGQTPFATTTIKVFL